MKVRSPLLSLALGLIASANAHAQALWTGTVDGSLNTLLNWSGDAPATANLVFSSTIRPLITVDAPFAANSMTFSGIYPPYTFSTPNNSLLSLGGGGISVAPQASSPVDFSAQLPVHLNTHQTWVVDGVLRVFGPVSAAPATVLTKTGTGTLVLGGASTFDGGVILQQGTLFINSSSTVANNVFTAGPLGLGQLTLASNTTFGAARPGLNLANNISLSTGVTLVSGSTTDRSSGLNLTGQVTTAASDMLVKLSGENPVSFAGTLDGPLNTVLRFQGTSTENMNGAAFTGTTGPNITALIADGAALYFASATALPDTVTVQATNQGYVSVVAPTFSPAIPVSTLLNRIADPSAFSGTFGFDTQPDAVAPPHVFRDDLDFSSFTHTSFRIGSNTEAVLTGLIAPPVSGGTATYHFGSGAGHIFVQSNLTDRFGATRSDPLVPASVVVTSEIGLDVQGIILGGLNTFSGTTTTAGVTSNLRVNGAMVVLDSRGALPAAATFSLGEGAYIGATEAAGFSTFADFLARLAPGGAHASSVLGLDSHAFVQDKLTKGDQDKTNAKRVVSGQVDLGSLTDGYLGTLTRVQIDGEVLAPSSGVLKLTGVSDGRLTIASNLAPTASDSSPNITRAIIGYDSANGSDEFTEGEVELTGASTYTGGTTLQSGALIIGNSSTLSGTSIASGPIGTGTLTVASSSEPVRLASNTVAGATLHNPIALTGPLQLGLGGNGDDPQAPSQFDPNLLILAGDISGAHGLEIQGKAILSGTNTYTGGTNARRGSLVFASTASLPLTGTLQSSVDGYIGLASTPLSLQTDFIDRFDSSNTYGTIGFDTVGGTLTVFTDAISLMSFATTNVRLGSATSARLTGTITSPDTFYRFGGGGGYLDVASVLTGNTSSVDVTSPHGASLTLRLSGANDYGGSTKAGNSAVIFAAGSLPASSPFIIDSNGYIGTEDAAFDTAFGGFLSHFAPNLDRGIIGFDAAPTNPPGSRTISTALDLTYFTATSPHFYLGTSTDLIFSAASSIILPANASAYRFAGYKGGRLQLDTVLSGAKGLVIGDPTSLMTQVSPAGVVSSVVLNAANTFSNGTTLYAGNLYLGTSSVVSGTIVSGPLGTGALTVEPNQFSNDLRPALRPFNGPITLANSLVLNSDLAVSSGLTLDGAISGTGGIYKVDAGTLTLSGNNSSWAGGVFVSEGNVTFTQDTSAGTRGLKLGDLIPTIATFTSAAPAIGSLHGDNPGNQLFLAVNSVLNISQDGSSQFLGEISGTGASVNIQGFNPNNRNQLTLGGGNLHTGGTTIGANVTVLATHNTALGTSGPVTLNNGTLAVGPGVTATFTAGSHPLVINGGKLRGTGTLAFDTSLNVKGDATGQVVLAPGLNQPGKLNLNFTSGATLILDAGGNYQWKLMDANNADGGWDTIAVSGGVQVNATSLAPFNLTIGTVSSDGSNGQAGSFDVYSSYSWTLLSASSITGFDSTKFNIDSSGFINQTFDGTFSIGLNDGGTSLMLNYTAAAIPEPSTWALMITGVAVLAVSALRRRRQ